jgi:hypothetical protein
VYLAADIKKIVSDEIYGPMFFQVRFCVRVDSICFAH